MVSSRKVFPSPWFSSQCAPRPSALYVHAIKRKRKRSAFASCPSAHATDRIALPKFISISAVGRFASHLFECGPFFSVEDDAMADGARLPRDRGMHQRHRSANLREPERSGRDPETDPESQRRWVVLVWVRSQRRIFQGEFECDFTSVVDSGGFDPEIVAIWTIFRINELFSIFGIKCREICYVWQFLLRICKIGFSC